jgi:transposase
VLRLLHQSADHIEPVPQTTGVPFCTLYAWVEKCKKSMINHQSYGRGLPARLTAEQAAAFLTSLSSLASTHWTSKALYAKVEKAYDEGIILFWDKATALW